MKDLLAKNNLDGRFQAEVLGAMRAGRQKMRAICLLGKADCGKSFLLKGLREVFLVYERPDSGSHQLEDLLDKEVVFLNDFEYDTKAKEWMTWWYFKNFLEGGEVPVARPKHRGSNTVFKGTAPVFMTAPRKVTLVRYGQEVAAETNQMRKRIRYLQLLHSVPEEEREEVERVCGHCSARVYLEGRDFLDADNNWKAPADPLASHAAGQPPPAKRQRTAQECVQELLDLKGLFDAGVLTAEELKDLKGKLLRGD